MALNGLLLAKLLYFVVLDVAPIAYCEPKANANNFAKTKHINKHTFFFISLSVLLGRLLLI
jgi:hypothetical protein